MKLMLAPKTLETVYIGLRVPRETYDALTRLKKSDDHDMTLSAVVRHILRQYLRESRQRKNGRKK